MWDWRASKSMIFRDEYDIQIEFGDLGNILAYLSIGDRSREIERLVSALSEDPAALRQGKGGLMKQEYIDPRVPFLPGCFLCGKESPSADGDGRADLQRFVMCYPPGIDSGAGRVTGVSCIISFMLPRKRLLHDRTGGCGHRTAERAGDLKMELWF